MIGWIIFILWALCAIQAWRIIAGVVIDDDMLKDGGDYIFLFVFGTLISVIAGPIVVFIRFIYWAWNYFGFDGRKHGGFIKAVSVPVNVETRSEKRERKQREADTKVRELKAKRSELSA